MPQPYDYAASELRTVEIRDITLELRPHHYHQWALLYGVEDPVLDRLVKEAQTARHIIDVGANIGAYSLVMHRAQPAGGKLTAFEPHPTTFAWLSRNIELNAAHGIRLEQAAVSDSHEDWAHVASPEGSDDSGRVALVAQGSKAMSGSRVQTVTLDKYLEERDLDIDLLKVDVEGFEAAVLVGAKCTIEKHRPRLVLEVSVDREPNGCDIRQCLHLLAEELGYRFYLLAGGQEVEPKNLSGFNNLVGLP